MTLFGCIWCHKLSIHFTNFWGGSCITKLSYLKLFKYCVFVGSIENSNISNQYSFRMNPITNNLRVAFKFHNEDLSPHVHWKSKWYYSVRKLTFYQLTFTKPSYKTQFPQKYEILWLKFFMGPLGRHFHFI